MAEAAAEAAEAGAEAMEGVGGPLCLVTLGAGPSLVHLAKLAPLGVAPVWLWSYRCAFDTNSVTLCALRPGASGTASSLPLPAGGGRLRGRLANPWFNQGIYGCECSG